jgi:hypothetical protein
MSHLQFPITRFPAALVSSQRRTPRDCTRVKPDGPGAGLRPSRGSLRCIYCCGAQLSSPRWSRPSTKSSRPWPVCAWSPVQTRPWPTAAFDAPAIVGYASQGRACIGPDPWYRLCRRHRRAPCGRAACRFGRHRLHPPDLEVAASQVHRSCNGTVALPLFKCLCCNGIVTPAVTEFFGQMSDRGQHQPTHLGERSNVL